MFQSIMFQAPNLKLHETLIGETLLYKIYLTCNRLYVASIHAPLRAFDLRIILVEFPRCG